MAAGLIGRLRHLPSPGLRATERPSWGGPASVVVSGLGTDTGGGVYVLEGDALRAVDAISSTGIAVSPDGRRLARLTWSDRREDVPVELLVYDRRGLAAYHRLDDARHAHSALWQEQVVVIASTGTNAILWVDSSGSVIRRWQAPGEGDCWHLNSLLAHRGRLIASAFGRFTEHLGWVDPAAREGTGIVFDVLSGRNVLTGFTGPHNPLWLGEHWLVCNSGSGELLRLDAGGAIVDRRSFPGWTRGLACDGNVIYLGVSAHRLRGEHRGTASLVALNRSDLEEVGRWDLPCREAYDVAMVPQPLVEGLRAGGRAESLVAG